MIPDAPLPPSPGLSLGITGHRRANPAMAAHQVAIEAALAALFDEIATLAQASAGRAAPIRLHSLLIDGVDQIGAELALARQWELVAPLPFGRALDCAINAMPAALADARALLAGETAADPQVAARAGRLRAIGERARLFELADQDAAMAELFLARLRDPADTQAAQLANFALSERVAMAGRVMIEQSGLLVAVWDAGSTSLIGGTGATIALALELGTPVLWIDARDPAHRRLLTVPEQLAGLGPPASDAAAERAALAALIADLVGQDEVGKGYAAGPDALAAKHWRPHSPRLWHAYRRIETLFGEQGWRRLRRLRVTYPDPDAGLAGPCAPVLAAIGALPGEVDGHAGRIGQEIVRRFAWADGISSRLSDCYRGGMILNFIFSALAIVGGIAYLPFATMHEKWMFASFELALLLGILLITATGQKRRWHGRWFETRRVAEYLRHAPLLLALGVGRPAGRWPRGSGTAWPERYARRAIRDVGLPAARVTAPFLHRAVATLLLPYARDQRAYHHAKARRLSRAQHALDRLSEGMFLLAVLCVATYLALKLGDAWWPGSAALAMRLSLLLSFFGVLLPTFGAALAGIRYFGDFERFAVISEVTAGRLDQVIARLALIEAAAPERIGYALVADLARTIDDIVIDEIESWQAVFAGKHVTVPV